MSIADFLINGEKLKYNHYIGIVCIIYASLVISLISTTKEEISLIANEKEILPKWIPVVFAILTPLNFTANGMLTKHLMGEKVGFNTNRIMSSVYLIVNFLILMVAIPYWYYVEFHPDLFYLGLIVAIFD